MAEEMLIDDHLHICKRTIEKIEKFGHSYHKWRKPSKRRTGEGEGEYSVYLKPPKPINRLNYNGSCSPDLSEDASSLFSSGSCSDLSEYDSSSKYSANSSFKGSPNTSAGNIKVEEEIKGE